MKKIYLLLAIGLCHLLYSQNTSFHDTQGSIEVNGGGQLQYTLPIALPPGIKSVAPQVNLSYTSGGGNGIAGYGWNLSGITSISRTGRTIEKDGEVAGIKLDYSDFYSFNGQRLILKSGTYGGNDAEYVTEKYSNVKIKSVGSIPAQIWKGPEFWEVTFEDGSQAWYGNIATGSSNATTPVEYNIVKWKDAQGNYISYNYNKINNVAVISDIQWGGNEELSGKSHFNKIQFNYSNRNLSEVSYVNGVQFTQDRLLQNIVVSTNGSQFKKYLIEYDSTVNVDNDPNKSIGYQFVKNIKEFNSNNEEANPVSFSTKPLTTNIQEKPFGDFNDIITSGDYNGDGLVDFLLRQPAQNGKPEGYYIYFDAINNVSPPSVYLGSTSTYFPSSQLLTFNIKSSDNFIKPKQGLVIIKSNDQYNPPSTGNLELKYYSIKSDASVLNTTNNPLVLEYSKIIDANQLEFEDSLYPDTNTPPDYEYLSEGKKSQTINFKEVDIDSDGLSELLFSVSDSKCYEKIIIPDPIKTIWNCTNLGYRNIVVDNNDLLANTIHTILPPTSKDILKKSSIMDFDNDGKQDIMLIEANGNTNVSFYTRQGLTGQVVQQSVSTPINNIYQYSVKKTSNNYSIELKNTHTIKGFTDAIQFGDLNGDRNIEILAPLNKGSQGSTYYQGWSIYLNNGLSLSEFSQGFASYYKNENPSNTYQDYTYPGMVDIDNDGKSEFFNFYAGYNQEEGFSNTFLWKLSEFKYDPNNLQFKWSYKNETIFSNHRGGTSMSPIYGDFRVNGSNSKILFVSNSLTNANDRKLISYHSYNLGVDKNISTISQAGVTTIIDYKELDPSVNPYLYAPIKKEQYPFMELDKVSQSYAVSQLNQEGRKQDFRYRGLITHLQGRGMIGFRQTARSSWYSDDLVNTKIWSGAEIDPLNEGLPIKEWSIKTNDETQIFPTNLSVNNSQLLSFKQTDYQTDVLANSVKAIIPIQSTTKDFLKDVTTINTITYGNYYLPSETVSNVNNGFAVSTTSIDYIHRPSGIGKDYFIGRPQFKTESVSAYNDTKTSLEEYGYNTNNLLQYLTKFDYDENEYIQEKYIYDEGSATGFGNITQKEITNGQDAQIIITKSQYEGKGRFVEKTTNNLGLETLITYNDWGQVKTQTDPLNNSITNVYDNWGKLLNSTSNLGGTTSYQYEIFNLAGRLGKKVTETSPDGNVKISYTNYLGQNYKNITKAFEQNKYVAKETRYDGLNRKIYESEPYFTTISPNYTGLGGSTITYDDTVFPAKVTVQAPNNGKKLETFISGRTTTIIEKNGYGRSYTKTTDAIGNLISSTDPGGTITYSYNAVGQQIKAQYAENIVTTTYDAWGRKSEFNDPANGKYEYQYNVFGDIKKETSRKGYKQYSYKPNGLLDVVIEKSNDGTSTDKNYTFTYDPNTYQLTQKSGTANGKSFTTLYAYRPDGRLGWTTEYLAGKEFKKQNIVYDQFGRVARYDQGLVSSGVTTTVAIQNIYNTWDGSLYQLKQENTNKILWELQTTNAKGQVLTAKLGAAQITNAYDSFGFLDTVKHISTSSNIMDTKYVFNAIKNELTERHHYNFNIDEYFTYDNNNRLTNWTNPKTGQLSSNTYDDKGRITVNDQLGNIGYTIGGNIYRASKINLNSNGLANYGIGATNILLQNISYNENNDPLKIRGRQNDYAFEYGLSESRQIMHYGGKFENNSTAKFTKYYSEDGSFEIIKNNQTGQEKHLLYIGGSPYESNIVYLKNFGSSTASFHFLHKDYLGSILAVTDESGYAIERRHYDAWGNFTNLIVAGSVVNPATYTGNLLVDRGYTSHEHLAGVGLIHMNGRLYDPLLRRFLNADENIQDPTNTQNYNKYGYVMNNPLMYNDPSGEVFFLIPILIASTMLAVKAVIISGIIYAFSSAISGNGTNGGFLKTITTAAISAFLFGGNSNLFSPGFWGTVLQGAAIGAGGGMIDAIVNGNNILKGLATGAVIGGAVAGITYTINYLVKYSGMKDEFRYSNGESSPSGESVEYSNKSLQNMRNKNFKPEEIRKYKVGRDLIGSENYSQTSDGFFKTVNGKAFAYTSRPNFFSGVSDIRYARAAFASKELLFTTMVHETAHSYIMFAGSAFINKLSETKLFSNGYSTLNDLGHASIYDLENYLSSINNFPLNPSIGYDKDYIFNAVNNNYTGNNISGFNILKKFLLPVFNRKIGVQSPF